EAARVLAPAGRWAGWWSHPRADDEDWFDQYWTAIEHASPGTIRTQRDTDWGAALGDSEWFESPDFVNVGWVREISVDDWLLDQSTHSTVVYLPPDERARLMATLTRILRTAFPDGRMAVPFETWMWIAPVAA